MLGKLGAREREGEEEKRRGGGKGSKGRKEVFKNIWSPTVFFHSPKRRSLLTLHKRMMAHTT